MTLRGGRQRPALGARQRLRFLSSQAGAAGVEFAFVVPVFLAAVLFVVETGRVVYSKVEFEYAVFNATRFGMVMKTADTDHVKQALSSSLILLNPAKLNAVTVSEVTNADKTRTATLTASYKVDFLVPVSEHKSLTLSKSVTFLRAQ
jgi:Flp pilus assembly protein TadG